MKINDLRQLVRTRLLPLMDEGVNEIYYRIADEGAFYPHIVFSFDKITAQSDDIARRNIDLRIDLWNKGTSAVLINDIADGVENLLDCQNLPQTNILPTIYFSDRRDLEDEDKSIQHIQIDFQIQNYERSND